MNNPEETRAKNTERDQARQPLVSIAMCTYNGERFLKEQLDSLLAQDYPNLEIIISDDRSTDSTVAVLHEYAEEFPQIRVLQNECNLGLVQNFEQALLHCSGDFIALCDQDDIWLPEKISTLVKQIGKAALIYTPVQMINEQSAPIGLDFYERRNIQPVQGKCSKALVFDNCILGHTMLFKRELLEHALPLPEGIRAHDQWIAILAATIGEIKFHDQVLSQYRMHESNAALKNRGKKKSPVGFFRRRAERHQRIRKKYQQQQALVNALSRLELLSNEDQKLFRSVAQTCSAFYRVIFNTRLYNLMEKEGGAFVAISKNKKKALRKICRGYWGIIFR